VAGLASWATSVSEGRLDSVESMGTNGSNPSCLVPQNPRL
jgi:hypothetical protein